MKKKRFLDYLSLPKEMTPFEREYLTSMNRVALYFFWLHPPVFALVAVLAGTSVWQALVLPVIVLIGPTIAFRTFTNQRLISVAYGITAMCMGGLLVHFGQGTMQIEMHFYFFVLIALLAVFANPQVVLAAAVTAALHHLVLFLLLPASIFNYEASIWTVVVHAVFVVLESVAACFVARSFFDNVIGLDKIVQARTHALDGRNADMRMVLENVGQGFLTVDREGHMSAERSAVVATWFGPGPESGSLVDYLGKIDLSFATWFQLGFDAVLEDVLPLELALDQMPRRLSRGGTTWELSYRPIVVEERLEKLLIVISDLTTQIAQERSEVERRELAHVLERAMRDGDGVAEFMKECDSIAARIEDLDTTQAELMRAIHTLKGNCAIFGVAGVSTVCHEVESAAHESGDEVAEAERGRILGAWAAFRARMEPLMLARSSSLITLTDADHKQFLSAVVKGTPRAQLLRNVMDWAREPAEIRFTRIADQVVASAHRLGKAEPSVVVDAGGLRLPKEQWAGFWSAFVHAVRNALDHGLESSEERLQNGKPERGRIGLSARLDGNQIEISLSDDGRGIDWERVREKAARRGLPHETAEDLAAALFVDGLSTRDEATETSGRGVGMGALRSICVELGGDITLESEPGRGTTVRVRLPHDEEASFLSRMTRNADSLLPGRPIALSVSP